MRNNYTVQVFGSDHWFIAGSDTVHLCLDRALKLARLLAGLNNTVRIVRELYGQPVVWHSEEDN